MSEEQKGEAPEAASEEELRAQLEDEIRKVRIEDLLLQSIVSVLNLSARRLAKDDERDLAQAKLGIDACRALVDFLPEEAQTQVREALTELQLLYAKHAGEQKTGDSEEKPADGEEKE